jgi:hypothetical protein
MNYSELERTLYGLVNAANRPLINILSLEHFLNYDGGGEKEYSVLLKSCIFFYKFGIDNRAQHDRLKNYNGSELPWNIHLESRTWIPLQYLEMANRVIRERNVKLWLKLMDYWYGVFYENPFFYLKWSVVDGWGWYHRQHVFDIRPILKSDWIVHATFVESIDETEMEILKAFGFGSFFMFNNPGSPSSDWWIIFGFWMIANGN